MVRLWVGGTGYFVVILLEHDTDTEYGAWSSAASFRKWEKTRSDLLLPLRQPRSLLMLLQAATGSNGDRDVATVLDSIHYSARTESYIHTLYFARV